MLSSNKEKYRHLCQSTPGIPIFSRDWWLDAVCGADSWDVAIVEKGGRVVGSMPYYANRKYGFTVLMQPPLTQTLGPWLRPSNAKYAKALGGQKAIMQALIDLLPSFDYFGQNWHHSNANWLPFYWRGFQQTTRYTYILSDLIDENQLWGGLKENIRGDIRKAEGRYSLLVRDDLALEDFLRINRLTFQRQGMRVPYSEKLVRRLDAACVKRNCRKIWIAEDDKGRRHAGVYVVWDENSAYYIMGGGDPELRNSGATSLCLWRAIRHAATVTQQFDFEGSMLEPVEKFFRGFGARQVPYFSVKKANSKVFALALAIRGMVKS